MTTQTDEFPDLMRRLLRAWMARVGAADTYDLAELVSFRGDVDAAIRDAIRAGRTPGPTRQAPWSWADIGDAVGISRQSAQERWGR